MVLLCLLSLCAAGAVCPKDSSIPFKLHRGYVVVVRGSVGGAKDLNFVVDTGAVPSVISQRIARKLKLRGTEDVLSTFARKSMATRVNAPEVRLGPLHASQMDVLVRDLSSVSETLGIRVDAIVGFDLLGRSAFTIDYGCKRLFFGPIDPSLASVPYKPGLAFPVVELAVGESRMVVVVDTGASALVLFEKTAQPYLSGAKEKGTETWSNLDGDVRVRNVQIPALAIGSANWSDNQAFVLEGAEAPYGVHGLLGPVALEVDRIAFDPEQSVFAWSAVNEVRGRGQK
jgi:predicted aspartyl protease